jgi:hypothetical protein
MYPKYNNAVPLLLSSLKSCRHFVDIRSVEENYRFRTPFFMPLGREGEREREGER